MSVWGFMKSSAIVRASIPVASKSVLSTYLDRCRDFLRTRSPSTGKAILLFAELEAAIVVFSCLRSLGLRHPTLVAELTRELLGIHPIFAYSEMHMDDDCCKSAALFCRF